MLLNMALIKEFYAKPVMVEMPAFVETFVVSHCLVINLALVFLKHVVG